MLSVRSWLVLGLASLSTMGLACGPKTPHGSNTGGSGAKPDDTVQTKTIKNADGSTSIITTTTKWVEAPDPPDRPADAFPADPLVKYNVDQLNVYRKAAGVGLLKYDAKLSAYALTGSQQLSQDHEPHAHFKATAQ